MKDYMASRRALRRQKLIDLAGAKCRVCESTDNLEFNHLDRTTKSFVLSGHNLDTAWDKILEEFGKCELVCSEHHKEYTRGQYSNLELRPWNDKTALPYVHGTVRCYQETKCKCIHCKLAKRLYRNKQVGYDEVVQSPIV